MRKTSTPSLVTSVVVACATVTSIAQSFNPVALTPSSYTHDIIVESTYYKAAPFCVTATVGGGTALGDYTFCERGCTLPPFNVTNGVPAPGSTITDLSNNNVQYTFAPSYTENNVAFIDSANSATLTFSAPTTCTNLSILGTSGGGSGDINYTVTHADFTQEAGTISFADWFNGTPFAYTTSGRVNVTGNGNDNFGTTNPRLYSRAITVSGASPVTDVSFSWASGGRISIFAVSGNATGTWTPIAVTGYNHDVIIEKAPVALPVTATMDRGTNLVNSFGQNTWFEKGYDLSNPANGLPPAGTLLTNLSNPTHLYQMAPSYAGPNAILIDTNNQTANITPATPANYSAFAILTAGGNIGGANTMTNLIIMQYADGTSETNLFFGYDWFNSSQPVAYIAAGRADIRARGLNALGTGNPRLFESTFGLANTVSPVTNIVLKYLTAPGASATTYVLGLAATAGSVAPVINSQSQFVNVFEGGNATFQVQLSAGSPPLTYIWQTNDVSIVDGGKVSGATTAALTLTGVEAADAGSYKVIVTNVAGATTSAPIALTVMSTNPDVTLPTDLITVYQPNGGSTPGAEGAPQALDNTTTKYLNFGANNGSPFFGPVGFTVTTSQGDSIVTGLRFYSANDAPDRDPVDYTLEGATDGVNYSFIASGSLSLPTVRNASGQPLAPLSQALAEVSFANVTPYSSYRVSFSNVRDAGTANCLQVGEVELLGTLSATAPIIVVDVHPTNVTAFAGLSSSLSLTAIGTPPLYYQWKLNGTPIPDATNASYTFTTLLGVNSYDCTVSNATAPVANSSTATVTGVTLTATTTFAVNFHNGQNRAAGESFSYSNIVYVGQGAYADVGNSNWNAWPNNGGYPAPTLTSAGITTPIALTLTNVGFNNGGLEFSPHPDGAGGNTLQGTPGFLLGYNAAVNNGNKGGIILSGVPDGVYNLYLYGANYDNDRGANFTVNGVTKTTVNDPAAAGAHPGTNFVLGVNYVVFQNLAPSNGVISGTWDGIFTNSITGQSGEGTFNGLQLVKVPTSNVLLSISAAGGNTIVSWAPAVGQLQQASSLTGTFNDVVGATSPYTNSPSASETYFRVRVQ